MSHEARDHVRREITWTTFYKAEQAKEYSALRFSHCKDGSKDGSSTDLPQLDGVTNKVTSRCLVYVAPAQITLDLCNYPYRL